MKDMIISNRYHVRSMIGQGGMADVYLAYDDILKRDVAVKILRESLSDDPVHVERFKREANAVALIAHRNIVKIFDVGDEGNKHYIIMEYVPGQTLKDLIAIRRGLGQEEAVAIMMQILKGISAAHEAHIIHRDLKPQNILVKDSGTVKITDFGIASIQNLSQVTQGDTIMGSLHYLAPEIVKGGKGTCQSDIYALGIMFYEMLTGKLPFTGDSPVNIAMKHIEEEIPSVREFNPTIYQSIENIIIKATAKSVDDRYKNADEMLADLESYIENKDEVKLELVHESDEQTIVANKKDIFLIEKTPEEIEQLEKERKKHRNRVIVYSTMAALAMIFIVLIVWIKFMHAGIEQVQIPNVLGMSEEEAIVMLEEEGFVVKEAEPKPSDNYEEGLVCKVYPTQGRKVDQGSEITITISSGLYLVMSDYVGMDFDEAYNDLSTKGFTINTMYVDNSSYAPNTVIEQSIEPNTKINPEQDNRTIRLKVVASYSYTMGNFYNSDITSAQGILTQSGLNVKLEVLTPPTDPAEIAAMTINKVVKQSIEVGTVITKKGTTVTLYYYDSKPEIEVTPEDTETEDTTEDTQSEETTESTETTTEE